MDTRQVSCTNVNCEQDAVRDGAELAMRELKSMGYKTSLVRYGNHHILGIC